MKLEELESFSVIKKPVFFQKIPITETTPPNAYINRYVGEVNGETVVEIVHGGAKWLVKERECLDQETALSKRAEELNTLIERYKVKHPRESDLIKAIGVCKSTYRKWNAIIQNHLKKV